MSDNEKVLLERAKNGDLEAFEILIEDYQKRVFNIAFRMIGNYEDASELAQEAFIRVFKSIKNFKEQSSFSTWIYRITTNVCLDEIRKRKNRKVLYIDEKIELDDGEMEREFQDTNPLPETIVENNEMKKALNEAIQSLSDEHRLVIIMRDIQGFSYEEIAHVTGCPQGTVKSRINRARQTLKNILKDKRELFSDEYVK